MTRSSVLLLVLFVLLLPCAVHALVTETNDQVLLNQPIDDDVIAAGGKVAVNAPVRSLIAAGGEIEINAPVEGDVIAAGGTITLNAPVTGKVLLAGGLVTLNSSVGRNVLIHSGEVNITSAATVGADALVSGGRVFHHGDVKGNLTVSSEDFTSAGTSRHLSYTRDSASLGERMLGLVSFALILFSLGMAILGLLAIRFAPVPYMAVEARVRSRPLVNVLAGLGGILGAIVLGVLLAITVVGLPLAICIVVGTGSRPSFCHALCIFVTWVCDRETSQMENEGMAAVRDRLCDPPDRLQDPVHWPGITCHIRLSRLWGIPV